MACCVCSASIPSTQTYGQCVILRNATMSWCVPHFSFNPSASRVHIYKTYSEMCHCTDCVEFVSHLCIALAAAEFVWSCLGLWALLFVFSLRKGPYTTLILGFNYDLPFLQVFTIRSSLCELGKADLVFLLLILVVCSVWYFVFTGPYARSMYLMRCRACMTLRAIENILLYASSMTPKT